ncbi:phosphoribosyl-AMP cyclohydrolase [Qipengyuania qiaonensis]|uniref:Phosphoribosyl-AMP cyclohydrolase n=1 Tax=Qipengyuania qiaonensis TaxID=2867240 RepID=A0ABS7J9U8_9SPHN|nr:phosphoribosyl-AMP cyclohydrolase [Qipengyuania qiaonensis]MBX7484089.1 phosphoribosyl-AMP cyclohydrolase [Qipengyuania qiaonensis]
MKTKFLLAAVAACSTFIAAPAFAQNNVMSQPVFEGAQMGEECISEQEVITAQEAWGNGIIEIGRVYSEGGDYRKAAADHIAKFYAYDLSLVLFKPTLAAVEQFRPTFDGALSYFVGGNPSYPEDKGFAITPWSKVRWQNAGITNNACNMAVAMGNYWFTPAAGGEETKVEYTIGYVKDADNSLRMVVHKSTIPYSGN